MRTEESKHAHDLKAVAYCAQSDGYLQKWAQEKMAEMAGRPGRDTTSSLDTIGPASRN